MRAWGSVSAYRRAQQIKDRGSATLLGRLRRRLLLLLLLACYMLLEGDQQEQSEQGYFPEVAHFFCQMAPLTARHFSSAATSAGGWLAGLHGQL